MSEQYDFLACRTLGHAWETDEAQTKPDIGWYMKLRCTRCGTERSDTVNKFGELLGRNYKHLVGYKHAKQSRSEWRAEFISGLFSRGRRVDR
jgi:hypothetical protein